MSRRRNINVNSVDIKKFTTDSTNITDYTPAVVTPPTITVTKTNDALGLSSMFIPTDLTGGTGGTPVIPLTNGKGDPSILVIVSVDIERPDADVITNTNISKEPIGFIVRYQ